MTIELLIIAITRLLGALPVLRWPFYGGLLALVIDQSDLLLMNLIHLGGIGDYQTFDKVLDQAYLLTFLIVALRWPGLPRSVAVGLFVFRFVGFVAFETFEERWILLVFPNLFESWFLVMAGRVQFNLEARLVGLPLAALLLASDQRQEPNVQKPQDWVGLGPWLRLTVHCWSSLEVWQGLVLPWGARISDKVMDLAGDKRGENGDADHAAKEDPENSNAIRVSLA